VSIGRVLRDAAVFTVGGAVGMIVFGPNDLETSPTDVFDRVFGLGGGGSGGGGGGFCNPGPDFCSKEEKRAGCDIGSVGSLFIIPEHASDGCLLRDFHQDCVLVRRDVVGGEYEIQTFEEWVGVECIDEIVLGDSNVRVFRIAVGDLGDEESCDPGTRGTYERLAGCLGNSVGVSDYVRDCSRHCVYVFRPRVMTLVKTTSFSTLVLPHKDL
jgi:hypothetical protein